MACPYDFKLRGYAMAEYPVLKPIEKDGVQYVSLSS